MPRIIAAADRWLKAWWIQLTLVFLLGSLLRYLDLAQIPNGIFHDEAWSDVKAMQINSGEAAPEIYFAENNGMDALHVYSIALLFRLTGPLAVGSRIMSALAGSLLILVTYWIAYELFFNDVRRRQLAVIAAFVVATLFWALTTSRSGWHTMSMALLTSTCLAALLRARRLNARFWFVISGMLAGLAQYTYPSARFLPFGLIALGLIDLWTKRTHWKSVVMNYALVALAALIVFAPLGLFFIQQPEWLFVRAQQTTSVNIGSNLVKTLLGFSITGDLDSLHNLPGRPALDPILSAFFIVGLVLIIRKQRQTAAVLLAWLIVFSLPVVLTDPAPLFRRWTGVLSVESIWIAVGAAGLSEWLTGKALLRMPRRAISLSIGTLLLGSGIWSVATYFGPYASNPQLFWAYDSGVSQVASYIRHQPDSTILLTPYDRFYEPIDIVLSEAPPASIQSFNGAGCTLFPATTARTTQWVVIVEKDDQTVPAIEQLFPNHRLTWQIDSPLGPYALAVLVPAGQVAQLNLKNKPPVDFGGKLQLIGFSGIDSVKRGQTMKLTLALEDVQPLDRLYKFFVHVTGSDNSIVAQDDRYPCNYTLNQVDWRPGNVVLQDFEVTIPAEVTPGTYSVELGVYDPDSGLRLPIGQTTLKHDTDQVALGTLTVK